MKVYKFEVYVLDIEDHGIDEAIRELDCRHFCVVIKDQATADIGEWDDDHVLNQSNTSVDVFRSYFQKEPLTPSIGPTECLHLSAYDCLDDVCPVHKRDPRCDKWTKADCDASIESSQDKYCPVHGRDIR